MKRNLETLSLALVAALALGAVVASAASAAPKLTPVPEEYPVTLKGTQTTALVMELEGGRPTSCEVATFMGEVGSKAEAEESKITVKPTYENCFTTILGNKDPATITLNGCDWLITATETTTGTIAAEGWEVTSKEFHLVCPLGAEVETHVYASKAKDEANEPLCTYKTAPQTPGGDQESKGTENNGSGDTVGDMRQTITGIAVTRVSGTLTNCGAAAQKGSLTGEAKTEGFNSKGEMIRTKLED